MADGILIVDDSMAGRRAVTRALAEYDFELLEAKDGAEALAVLRANSIIRLILCDVHMPVLNGLEFLRLLRADREYDKLRFVFLSTDCSPALRRQASELGAVGWLSKLSDRQELVTAIVRLMDDG